MNMNFEEVVARAKNGRRVRRASWPSPMFAEMILDFGSNRFVVRYGTEYDIVKIYYQLTYNDTGATDWEVIGQDEL